MEDIDRRPGSKWSLVGKDPQEIPLDKIDLAHPGIWQANEYLPFLKRLRAEAPVHYCAESATGPYWSVTKYKDIMEVDTSPHIYSSEPTIGIVDAYEEFTIPSFISMDPPKHDEQRRVVQGVVAPSNLKELEGLIRQRAQTILDGLPIGEEFDWVETNEERWEAIQDCLATFTRLWNERINKEPGNDLISMLAHGEATKNMPPMEYLGNILLLIVGGNDTTRNSITGGVLALNQFPEEYDKLRADVSLIPNMVSEIIRWQTPLAYMRRTAKVDTELNGQHIKKGDKVIMWYASGNQDDEVIENPERLIVDRPNARQHLSFGFGLHRCMGNRLAEMQLRIVWEEIMQRFEKVEVVGEPERIYSSFVKGYSKMNVILHPKQAS
jgi:cytochrome P450